MIRDLFINSIMKRAMVDTDLCVPPLCILWPDYGRQFEATIPYLQTIMPNLLVLGEYNPKMRIGPAIWLRCVIERTESKIDLNGKIPVVYLPGISHEDLKHVETCSELLSPLLYLQYRGVVYLQYNGKDMTPLAFLVSRDGGLNLDVAGDEATQNALAMAFPRVLEKNIDTLNNIHLDKKYFNSLISGGDSTSFLLQWLNSGDKWKNNKTTWQWKAFVQLCISNYQFNPEKQGHEAALIQFANRQGAWKDVYERFCEAYTSYPEIMKHIQRLPSPDFDLFADEEHFGGWPQWNEYQEQKLADELEIITNQSVEDARHTIAILESQFAKRRETFWGKSNKCPLAIALGHLAQLSKLSNEGYLANTLESLTSYYEQKGYMVDLAAWQAVEVMKSDPHIIIIKTIVNLFYYPWLDNLNKKLHFLFKNTTYPSSANIKTDDEQCCYLFVDGLRLDHAHVLKYNLEKDNNVVIETYRWAPLPSITANGKPAAVPTINKLLVGKNTSDYDPIKAAGTTFSKYLSQQNLSTEMKVQPDSVSWAEFGDIDKIGHEHGADMPLFVSTVLNSLLSKINYLFNIGFKTVRIVTDHGWLWMPGGFQKSDLPKGLTDDKKGRYASIKDGVKSEELKLPWHWNNAISVSLAPSIFSHQAGMAYTHGGLSLQECRLMELVVRKE